MSIQVDKHTRKHVHLAGEQLVQLLKQHNLIMDATGKYAQDLIAIQNSQPLKGLGPNRSVIYYTHFPQKKAGFTRHFHERKNYYPQGTKFLVVCLPDSTFPPEVDRDCQSIVNTLLKNIIQDEQVPKPLKFYLQTILERGAGSLGVEVALVGRLIEIGVQRWWKLVGVPAEGFSFDQTTWNYWQQTVETAVTAFQQLLVKHPLPAKTRDCFAMMSWAPDVKGQVIPTKHASTLALVKSMSKMKSPLPKPAIQFVEPPVKNPSHQQRYSNDYPEHELKNGRSRIDDMIVASQLSGDFFFADTNHRCEYPDTSSQISHQYP